MKRAFSLAETLVAGSLAFLLLALLTRLLIPLLRSSQRSAMELELGQLARIASQLVTRDLQAASSDSLRLAESDLFALQMIDGVTDTGKRVYSDRLVLYRFLPSTGELVRKECSPADLALDASNQYTGPQLQGFFQQLPGLRRTLLRGVLSSFQLTPVSPERQHILHLQMMLRNNDRRFQVDEIIALRNERP